MNFRRGSQHEEPEINFIPLIDVLMVILIFLIAALYCMRPLLRRPTSRQRSMSAWMPTAVT